MVCGSRPVRTVEWPVSNKTNNFLCRASSVFGVGGDGSSVDNRRASHEKKKKLYVLNVIIGTCVYEPQVTSDRYNASRSTG